ncbi:MAG TPA: sortase [Candidatus Onthousia faecavium]|nr:sortase [Candidatus Onthousia faecavium]
MLRKSLISFLLLTIYLGSCLLIYTDENKENTVEKAKIENSNTNYLDNSIVTKNDVIATLEIPKINLKRDIYSLANPHNNVEENVTILTDTENLIVLAAHSGPGDIAYFNDLDKLILNDTINLTYKNTNQLYKITNIEEQPKDGNIEIKKSNQKRLILTTCSKKSNNKQLVIIAKIEKDDLT